MQPCLLLPYYPTQALGLIYLQKGNIRFKHSKLMAIYSDLAKKNGYFQTQKTIFTNTFNSILISKVKDFD